MLRFLILNIVTLIWELHVSSHSSLIWVLRTPSSHCISHGCHLGSLDVFRGFVFFVTGVVAPEGYHEPSLQKKDSDASSHLRQMMNGEWRLKFQGGENSELLGRVGRDFRNFQDQDSGASRLDALTCHEL